MNIYNNNRYRVSTNFILLKIFVYVVFFSIIFNLIRDFRNDTVTQKSIAGLALATFALSGVFYFIRTRKRIDYDDTQQVLFVVDTKSLTEIEIQVEHIDKILYSAIGKGSYVIKYRDFHNQSQKIHLFPIPFENSINTIITDTKLKNPELVTRKWSFGWNELCD